MSKRRNGKKLTVQMMVVLAMMIALEVVLSRLLAIPVGDSLKFAFNFVPVVVAAYLYGPVASLIVAAVGDLIGSLIFPVGAYFPGFTATAALTGLCFGLFLNNNRRLWRIIISVVIIQVALTIFLDSVWFMIYFGTPYWVAVATRAVKAGVMVAVQCVSLAIILPIMERVRKQLKI